MKNLMSRLALGLSIMVAVVYHSVVNAEPQTLISTTNVLLPPSPGVFVPVKMNKGCWVLSSVETPEASLTSLDDEIVHVKPVPLSSTEEGCIVEPEEGFEEDDECFREFRIVVKDDVKLGAVALIFAPRSDPEKPQATKETLRVDVRVEPIAKLEIQTTTKRIEIGETEILQVIGRDVDYNVFSTLVGLDFNWHVQAPGLDYLSMAPLSEANIIVDSKVVDKSRQSVVGLSTGRAIVHVQLIKDKSHTLKAEVELIVSRLVSVCPGSLVGLIVGSKLTPSFCLRKIGCFPTAREYGASPLRPLKEFYDWKENIINYSKEGFHPIQVEDLKEPSNRGFSQVFVAPAKRLALNVAPFSSARSTSEDSSVCSFAKSKGSSWPPLSRLFPPQQAFRASHKEKTFTLTRTRKYVLLGLAALNEHLSEQADETPLYATPSTHELIKISFAGHEQSFDKNQLEHALVVTPQKSGLYPVELTFRDLTEQYTLRVVDELTIVPSSPIIMTTQCEMRFNILGGSGTYKSRIKGSHLASSLVNSTNIASGSKLEEFKLLAWDVMDDSNSLAADVRVAQPTKLRFKQGPRLEIVVGSLVTVDVEAFDDFSQRPFACCSNQQVGFYEMPEQSVDDGDFLVPQQVPLVDESRSCARMGFVAARPGLTRIYAKNVDSFVEVLIVPSLTAQPPQLQMALGDEYEVRLIGGREDGKIRRGNELLSGRIFKAKCESEGQFTFDFVLDGFKEEKTTFKLECYKAVACQLNMYSSFELVTSNFVQNMTRVQLKIALLAAGGQSLRVPAKALVEYSSTSGPISNEGEMVLQGHGEDALFSIKSKVNDPISGQLTCDRKIVVREEMKLISPSYEKRLWFWGKNCPQRFILSGGSNEYSVSAAFPTDKLVFSSPNSLATQQQPGGQESVKFGFKEMVNIASKVDDEEFQLVFEDKDYFPQKPISLHVSFQPVTGISVSQTPSFAVQNTLMRVKLTPRSGPSTWSSANFDWSAYNDKLVRFSWSPSEAFELVERPVINEFVLRASPVFEGKGVFRVKLCSPCNPEVCVDGKEERFTVERHRSAVIMPGTRLDLTQCYSDGQLGDCSVANVSSNLVVLPNGTITTSTCDSGKFLVACVSKGEKVYFDVFVEFPSSIDLFPFHPSESWVLLKDGENQLQAQAKLRFQHQPTCGIHQNFADVNRKDDYDFYIVDDSDRNVQRKAMTSYKGIASADLKLPSGSKRNFNLKVTGRLPNPCQPNVNLLVQSKEIKIQTGGQIEIVSPKQVLLPPRSRLAIQAKALSVNDKIRCQVSRSCSSNCGIKVLDESCVIESLESFEEDTPCVVEVFSSKDKQFIVAQVSPIGGFRAGIELPKHALGVSVFDVKGREFTSGWFDADNVKRRLNIEPSKHVQVEILPSKMTVAHPFQVNFTSANALGSVSKVVSLAKKSQTWLKVEMVEDDTVIGVALIDRIERKCERTFLGYFCVDGFELVALGGIVIALALAVVQGSSPEFYVFLMVVAVYFAAF